MNACLRRAGAAALGMIGAFATPHLANAGSYDVKAHDRVVLKRSGASCADDRNCTNRIHPAIPPVARAKPGDLVVFETRDAADTDFNLDTQFPRDLRLLHRNKVHPLTGPVHIEGAKRGDVLAITIVDIEPVDYGFTLISPIGLLSDKFPGPPRLFNWKLDRGHATSTQIPGVRVPYAAFPGIVTVMPGPDEVKVLRDREAALAKAGGAVALPEPDSAVPAAVCGPQGSHRDECLRTIPPREHGGNMDVRYMTVGTTLLIPCFIDGCGLAIGDVHYAQGDGEVSGTAIEMAATVTVRTEIRPGRGALVKVPHYEGTQFDRFGPRGRFYATTGIPTKEANEVPPHLRYLESAKVPGLTNLSNDLMQSARNALLEMIDWMVRERGLTRDQAYALASVVVDLRIGQVVDSPNLGVTAILPLDVFVGK